MDISAIATVPVPKAKAIIKTGKKHGKLRLGCRYKGKRVLCTPAVAAKLGHRKGRKRGKGKSKGGKHPCSRPNPPAWCNRKAKSGIGKLLKSLRARFKKGGCRDKMDVVRTMNTLAHQRRMGPIFDAEVRKKIHVANDYCRKHGARADTRHVPETVATRRGYVISGMGKGKKGRGKR